MNDDSGSTHTGKTVPAALPVDYDMAFSSEVPPKPIVVPVAQPGYQYAPQQPQTVQPVAQPRYQYAQQQPRTVQPVAQPGYQYGQQQPQTVQPVAQPGYQYAPQQPQTVQPDHQPAHYLSPQQPQTAQPVMLMVQQLPKEAPGQMMCPRCQTSVVSIVQYKRGVLSWVLCSVFAVLLLWPFFWIPLVADACKDVEHSCPICKTVLHVYKRK